MSTFLSSADLSKLPDLNQAAKYAVLAIFEELRGAKKLIDSVHEGRVPRHYKNPGAAMATAAICMRRVASATQSLSVEAAISPEEKAAVRLQQALNFLRTAPNALIQAGGPGSKEVRRSFMESAANAVSFARTRSYLAYNELKVQNKCRNLSET